MRYIKKYNESNSEVLDEQEIKDFCEMNLAYLVDEGLNVIIDDYQQDKHYFPVILSLRRVTNSSWDEVKDQIIPFLIRLKSQFNLFSFEKDNLYYDIALDVLFKSGGEIGAYTHYLTADDLVNDRIGGWIKSNCKIKTISFNVKNKKEV
jgi:hypothetical protein